MVWEDPGSNLTVDGWVYRSGYCNMQPWAWAAHLYCSAWINSALQPIRVTKWSASFGWGKSRNVTSAAWQVTLCDPIWHTSVCSGEAGLLIKGEPIYCSYLLLLHLLKLLLWRTAMLTDWIAVMRHLPPPVTRFHPHQLHCWTHNITRELHIHQINVWDMQQTSGIETDHSKTVIMHKNI